MGIGRVMLAVMHSGRLIFSQLLDFLPRYEFAKCVDRYDGNRRVRTFSWSVHEVNVLDDFMPEPGSYYLMDKGFIDFRRLYRFTLAHAFFITRAKVNLDYRVRESRPVDRDRGLRADQTIRLIGPLTRGYYPMPLRG
jgi:hypothetical protein